MSSSLAKGPGSGAGTPGLWSVLAIALSVLILGYSQREGSLLKGQVVKQFYTHTLTESLPEVDFHPLRSELACPRLGDARLWSSFAPVPQGMTSWRQGGESPGRTWVEEPPIYQELGAGLLALGATHPATLPLVISGLMALVSGLFARGFLQSLRVPSRFLAGLAIAAIVFLPVNLRYSIQHIPDGAAVLFLALGAGCLLKDRRLWGVLFLTAAVTTKVFLALPAGAVVLGSEIASARRNGRTFRFGLRLTVEGLVLVLPFLAWLGALIVWDVPNGYGMHEISENRHVGTPALLVESRFWVKLLLWVIPRGVGWGFGLGFLAWLFRGWRHERRPEDWVFGLWLLSAVPFVVLFRQGTFVHDYYLWSFLLPAALWGMRGLFWVFSPGRSKLRAWALGVVLALSVVSGIVELLTTRPVAISRETLCAVEGVTNHGAAAPTENRTDPGK